MPLLLVAMPLLLVGLKCCPVFSLLSVEVSLAQVILHKSLASLVFKRVFKQCPEVSTHCMIEHKNCVI